MASVASTYRSTLRTVALLSENGACVDSVQPYGLCSMDRKA
jgi:hypothetical protein